MDEVKEKSIAQKNQLLTIALVPLGIGFNLGIGTIVTMLKLPVYVDAVGTIIVTLLVGWKAGALTGIASFLLGGLITNPVLPFFSGTQLFIALYAYFIGKRGGFRTLWLTIISGIGLGVVAGIVSAPIITYLFGGITGSGPSLVVAYLLSTGKGLIKSVLLSGLASEPLDKTIQCLLATWLLRGVPKTVLKNFDNDILRKNKFI